MRTLILVTIFWTISLGLLLSLEIADIRFCLDHEYYYILDKYKDSIHLLIDSDNLSSTDLDCLLEYAQRTQDSVALERVFLLKAVGHQDLESALDYVSMMKDGMTRPASTSLEQLRDRNVTLDLQQSFNRIARYNMNLEIIGSIFSSSADSLLFFLAVNDSTGQALEEVNLLPRISRLNSYNDYIESFAKARIDDIGVERIDSVAVAAIEKFYMDFPHSKWHQAAYYYHLYHLRNSGSYDALLHQIELYNTRSPEHAYISSLFLAAPAIRQALPNQSYNHLILESALQMLITAEHSITSSSQILYDQYASDHFLNKIKLQKAKLLYYLILDSFSKYGNEDSLYCMVEPSDPRFQALFELLQAIEFENNATGEQAELNYWKAKSNLLINSDLYFEETARLFAKALISGSPRSSYDSDSWASILLLHRLIKVKTDPMSWVRSLLGYTSARFSDISTEYNLGGTRYTRIAVGDYDNDGWQDLLFNGTALYRNNENSLNRETNPLNNFTHYPAHGALWADFNRDGLLDFATVSNHDLMGEQLMKQMPDSSFVSVNERAGDISNPYPTEGMAWVDIRMDSFPDIYMANYEKWQVQPGYPDNFWQNNRGYFQESSDSLGFRDPLYTVSPGLAGRGVAPADFDNDGLQEIYVANYRLTRNFLWNFNGDIFTDIAAFGAVQGNWSQGYYGHSIGADWGDYDNDGDLDLFVANLAHPRFLDFSDISVLYRNDGLSYRVVESDTLYYWQFTDVTKNSGITYDELHSDPLWIDIDNDGDLDLFISCVYDNARSYLYQNMGDGTFQDITWLSGSSVYNGWGNAMADLNRDGLPEIICGSGSGTTILLNQTTTSNKSVWIKPVWTEEGIVLIPSWQEHHTYPNSPAFGARVELELLRPDLTKQYLIRELSSAKGTTSQSAQELHFGLGEGTVTGYRLWSPSPNEEFYYEND